jgi:hypothetical protein
MPGTLQLEVQYVDKQSNNQRDTEEQKQQVYD